MKNGELIEDSSGVETDVGEEAGTSDGTVDVRLFTVSSSTEVNRILGQTRLPISKI